MGDFFTTFLKELNSTANKNMISLAFVLGLISGFLPTFTVINYFIYLFILIFRIPIGLYSASFVFFTMFSYVLDPLFNKIGYFILTNSFLKSFWTFLYNMPLMRWSGYNNTLVMGSLISGILVGIVFYIFLSKYIAKYRQTVFPKIKKIKYLSWIVPSEEKKGILRISGIVVAVVLIGSFVAVVAIFLDPLLKFLLAFSLSKALHKKVYIESLSTKLSEPSIYIKNMKIDTFLISQAYAKLNMTNILWRKFDIENLTLKAKTNSSLAVLLNKKNSTKQEGSSFKLPKIKLSQASEIFAKQQLKSEKALEKLNKDYQAFEAFYKNYNFKQYKNQINIIKKEIEALKNTKIKNLNDVEKLKAKLNTIEKQIKKVNIQADIQLKQLKKYKSMLKEDIASVKTAVNEDYKNINNQFSLIKTGKYMQFAQFYFKPEIDKYINTAQFVIEKIKPYIHNNKEETPKIIPRSGIYIKFQDKIKYPDFVLRHSDIFLKTSIADYNAILNNISDNQKLLRKHAKITVKADSRFYKALLNADYYDVLKFKGYADNIVIKKLVFNQLRLLHPKINIKFFGIYDNKLNAVVNVYFNNTVIKYISKEKFAKYLNSVLGSVNKFVLRVKIDGNKTEISSDIDKIISKSFEKIYQKEINLQKQKAFKMLNEKVNKNLAKYNIKSLNMDIKNLNDLKSYTNKLLDIAKKEFIKKQKSSIKNKILNKIKLF